jgi:hypothetical protein
MVTPGGGPGVRTRFRSVWADLEVGGGLRGVAPLVIAAGSRGGPGVRTRFRSVWADLEVGEGLRGVAPPHMQQWAILDLNQ